MNSVWNSLETTSTCLFPLLVTGRSITNNLKRSWYGVGVVAPFYYYLELLGKTSCTAHSQHTSRPTTSFWTAHCTRVVPRSAQPFVPSGFCSSVASVASSGGRVQRLFSCEPASNLQSREFHQESWTEEPAALSSWLSLLYCCIKLVIGLLSFYSHLYFDSNAECLNIFTWSSRDESPSFNLWFNMV